MEVRITGLDDVAKLARDLKKAGDTDLRREMREAGKRIGKRAEEAVRESAGDLPSTGGLNSWVQARIKIKPLIRLQGRDVGIRVKTSHRGKTGASDIRAMNNGRLRAPLFGDTDHWYLHRIPPGFVTRPLEAMSDDARDEFLTAIDEIARRFAAGG